MGNEQSSGGDGAATSDRTINKGNHPPPLPLIAEAEKAQLKRHFPHAKRLYMSALESIIHFTGENSIEAARCRVKVGEMCMQEKKFDEALVYLKEALRLMEIMRKDFNPATTPNQQETKKLIGDIAYCEYNLAQKESRGSSNYNKLSIAALEKFQAISEMNQHEGEGGEEYYVTELLGEDFAAGRDNEQVRIPETGGQAQELAVAGVQDKNAHISRAADGMNVAKQAEETLSHIKSSAKVAEGEADLIQQEQSEANSETRVGQRKEGLGRRTGIESRVDGRQTTMSTPEARAVAKRRDHGPRSQADCNLIVASLHANTNNPVQARKVLQSTASMQRKRKVPVNATQRLAVGLDAQMRQLNALTLIQRGLMRIIRRIRLRNIFRLQRELVEEWEASMRDAIYEFEDDICYNWTGLDCDTRETRQEEDALRWEMIRDEVDDLNAALQLDYEDLNFEAEAEFDGIMADYKEFLEDLQFAQRYDPQHWQNCLDQMQIDEPDDRRKIKMRENEEWDALMQMMKISAMGAKRKEDERHAAYARVKRELNEGVDAGADDIRKQEQDEWDQIMNQHFEWMINDLVEQERRARPKVADLPYQREFWRTLADDEEDERAEIIVRDQQRERALRLASEKLEREMMESRAAILAEEQDMWNKMMRQMKKELPLALKREEESKKREEVKARLTERNKGKELAKQQRELAIAEKLVAQMGNMNGLVGEERVAKEIKLMKRRRSTKLPLSMEDLELLQRHFKFADVDESGDIDREEFAKFCSTVPTTKLTRQQADDLFDLLDKDGDGVLNFEEFCETYDHMDGVLAKPTLRRRASSVVTTAEPPTPVAVEEPLTPTDTPPLKNRRRSMRQPTTSNTSEVTPFLLEDEATEPNELADEIDTTPASSSLQQSVEPTPTPTQPSMTRRRSLAPKYSPARAETMTAALPEDSVRETIVEDNLPLEAAAPRRPSAASPQSNAVSPSTSELVTPVSNEPLTRRRSAARSKRVTANTQEQVQAVMPEEEAVTESIEEPDSASLASITRRRSSVSPQNDILSPPASSVAVVPAVAPASRRRSGPTSNKSSTAQEQVQAVMPEEEHVSERIEETENASLTTVVRRRSSGSPQSSEATPASSAVVSPATRQTSVRRRAGPKSNSGGTQEQVQAVMPEEEPVTESIEEPDSAPLASAARRRASVSPQPPPQRSSAPTTSLVAAAAIGAVGGAAAGTVAVSAGSRKPKAKRSGSGTQDEIQTMLPEEEVAGSIAENEDASLASASTVRRHTSSMSPQGAGNTSGSPPHDAPSTGSSEAAKITEVKRNRGRSARTRPPVSSPAADSVMVEDTHNSKQSESSASNRELKKKVSGRGAQQGNTAALVEDAGESVGDNEEGLVSMPRRQRSAKRTAASAQQSGVDAESVEHTGESVGDNEEGLVSMPRRQRSTNRVKPTASSKEPAKTRSGAGLQDAADVAMVDFDAPGVVDDLEASRLVERPARKRSSVAGSIVSSFGTEQSSGDYTSRKGSRSVSIVEDAPEDSTSRARPRRKSSVADADAAAVEASGGDIVDDLEASSIGNAPQSASSRSKARRHRPKGAGTAEQADAAIAHEQSVIGMEDSQAHSLRPTKSDRVPPHESPPERAISPQEMSNPRRSVVLASKTSPTSPQESGSSAFDDRAVLKDQLSQAQIKEEGKLLIRRLLVRAQRTKGFSLSPDDLETIRSHFNHCDLDSNNRINRQEFIAFANSAMDLSHLTQRDIESLFDKMDADGSGALSFREFVDIYRHLVMREVAKRDPALAQSLEHSTSARRRSVNTEVFGQQAARAIGEPVDLDLAESLSFDPEFVRTTAEWNAIAAYVASNPSRIGDTHLSHLQRSLQRRADVTKQAIGARGRLRRNGGHTGDVDAAMVGGAGGESGIEEAPGDLPQRRLSKHRSSNPLSPSTGGKSQQSFTSPTTKNPSSSRLRRKRDSSGATSDPDAAAIDEEEQTAIEDEFGSLRDSRLSNRHHRLLWDRPDRPPWSLPAVDEVQQNENVRVIVASADQNEAIRILGDFSTEKGKLNEQLFEKFPFLEPLPCGVPLSELGIEANQQIKGILSKHRGSSGASLTDADQEQISSLVKQLAKQRIQSLNTFVGTGNEYADMVRNLVATEQTRRRMSRRMSHGREPNRSDSDSSSDDNDAAIQRLHEEREAELNRRRQEIAQTKEEEARRKEQQEEAMRRQRENDAHDLKSKNHRLRQLASNKAEAEGLIKRCIIRAGKSGASGEADLDVNDLAVIKSHFDFCDEDDSGGINRQRFIDFYTSTFDSVNALSKKEIDEIFKSFASDGNEVNFMEFVEVYKHAANQEIQKKEEKLGRKKSSMAPKKPASQRSLKPNGRGRR